MGLDFYITLVRTYPEHLLGLLFLALARIMPIVILAPFFGSHLMPMPARIGFALCLFAILLPYLFLHTSLLAFDSLLIVYGIKEALIGLLIGFLASIPFFIAQMTGIIIDNQRGSSSMMGQDVTTGTQVSTIGQLYNFMMIVIFYSLDGPFIVIDALVKSYHLVGPDQMLHALFFSSSNAPFWDGMMGLMSQMAALSTQLAAPPLLTILMTDAFLGVVNRLAPQVQIAFLGQGLKAFLGDVAMWLGWFFILHYLSKIGINWLKNLSDFVDRLNFG